MPEEHVSSSEEVIIGGDDVDASDESSVAVSIKLEPREPSDESSRSVSIGLLGLSVGKARELFSKLDQDGLGEGKMLYSLSRHITELGIGSVVGSRLKPLTRELLVLGMGSLISMILWARAL